MRLSSVSLPSPLGLVLFLLIFALFLFFLSIYELVGIPGKVVFSEPFNLLRTLHTPKPSFERSLCSWRALTRSDLLSMTTSPLFAFLLSPAHSLFQMNQPYSVSAVGLLFNWSVTISYEKNFWSLLGRAFQSTFRLGVKQFLVMAVVGVTVRQARFKMTASAIIPVLTRCAFRLYLFYFYNLGSASMGIRRGP